MTLRELTEALEHYLTRNDAIPDGGAFVDISSGGLQAKQAQPPVLCEDANLAIELWRTAAIKYADDNPGTEFRWIEKPTLDKWHITITDERVTHRATSSRYAVFARIAILPAPIH